MVEINDPSNYSIILNRTLQIKISENILAKIESEIFVFKDDDGNFKLDADLYTILHISLNSKKITSLNAINNFIKDYKKVNKIDINKIVNSSLKEYYKKYKNKEIKELAKEHNIIL